MEKVIVSTEKVAVFGPLGNYFPEGVFVFLLALCAVWWCAFFVVVAVDLCGRML